MLKQDIHSSHGIESGDGALTDDPGTAFLSLWDEVVAELNGESPEAGPRHLL